MWIAPTNDTIEKNTQTPLCPSQQQHFTDITTNDIGVIDLSGNRPLQDDKNTEEGSHAEHQESDERNEHHITHLKTITQ